MLRGLGTHVYDVIDASLVSNGENGTLSSTPAPLFASLFPERDRSCHLMVHQNSDDGTLCSRPLGFRSGQPLDGLMTLQNFIDGGHDIPDAKVLAVVKSIGAKKQGLFPTLAVASRLLTHGFAVTRKDQSTTENVSLRIHDDTAEGTLGLWGSAASSPFTRPAGDECNGNMDAVPGQAGWKPGETVLLLQAPGWKIGRSVSCPTKTQCSDIPLTIRCGQAYLSMTSATILDVDPNIPDTEWLRRWSLRQKSREAINPPFPEALFDLENLLHGPVRCLYSITDLDESARAAPTDTSQGYLSVLVTDVKLHETYKRRMLFAGECCNMPLYANALTAVCKGCEKDVALRLNPRIIGQVMDLSLIHI